ncbi:hypothetical protein LPB138_04905 [Urechidicola croceus]|uniref:Uncharacterized protein n=1 Tax=Urechidicola croceus TaxID=1850246 RepID=A0A1D8P655_9FLAO|nr:hypothetical protein LPB138_04905 [Urechidicola croceus]
MSNNLLILIGIIFLIIGVLTILLAVYLHRKDKRMDFLNFKVYLGGAVLIIMAILIIFYSL